MPKDQKNIYYEWSWVMMKLAVAKNMVPPNEYDLFHCLSLQGWDITIFVSGANEPQREYENQNLSGYNFRVQNTHGLVLDLKRFKLHTSYLHIQYGLLHDLCRFKPDVILSSELGIRTILSLLYGFLCRIPVVVWIGVSAHSERNNSMLREMVRRYLVKIVPCICTNMSEAQQYFRESLKVTKDKLYNTPYSFDVCRFRTMVEKSRDNADTIRSTCNLKRLVFLYVGQMIKRKGITELVHALEFVDGSRLASVSFLFIGGQLPDSLRKRLDKIEISYSVIPFIQPGQLYQYYAVADVFILPSLEDEWGVVVNEAASATLPIISSIYAAATAELVIDGYNGFAIDPFNPQNTAQAIMNMIDMSDEKRAEWGMNSYELVKKIDVNFTVKNMHCALTTALTKRYGKFGFRTKLDS